MTNGKKFYNVYHQKNSSYFKIINRNNFTYFNILPFIDISTSLMRTTSLRILDVGCGVGTLDFYLANKGFTVKGLDLSSRAISICNQFKRLSKIKNVSFSQIDVEKMKENSKYDLIICTEVIEHIQNDLKFIKKLHSLLKDNGSLVLSTPSLNSPLYRAGLLKKFDYEVGHLRRYSIHSITNLLESGEFKVVELKRKEGILRNSLFMFKPLGFLIKFIRGPLISVFHWVDEFSIILFGESDLIVVAKKYDLHAHHHH